MRRKQQTVLFKKIADIRQLQRVAAEAELARAVCALSQETQALKVRQDEEGKLEEHWKDAVLGSSLRLETMPIWAHAVARQSALTQHATAAVDNASLERDRSAAALCLAERHSDVAGKQAQQAWNDHLRELEEGAVQDAADRHLQYGVRL